MSCCGLQVVEAVLQVVSAGCAAAPAALQLLGPALQLILRAGVPVQQPDLESIDGDGVSQPVPSLHFVKICILLDDRTEVIDSVMAAPRPCREGATCLLSYSRRPFLPSIVGLRQFNAGCVPTVVPVSPLSSSI